MCRARKYDVYRTAAAVKFVSRKTRLKSKDSEKLFSTGLAGIEKTFECIGYSSKIPEIPYLGMNYCRERTCSRHTLVKLKTKLNKINKRFSISRLRIIKLGDLRKLIDLSTYLP